MSGYSLIDVDTYQALCPEVSAARLHRLFDLGDRHGGDYRVVDQAGRAIPRSRALREAELRRLVLRSVRGH